MNKIKLESNIIKQNSIEEQLIFKASVEKYKDEISDNVIAINEFELKLDISKSNRCKYAHIFCYVDDYEIEGYSLVELKRDIKVDEATQEELEQIVWNINSKDILAYNGKTKIQHNIKEEKVYKTIFNAYIKDNQTIESSANTSAVFDENLQQISNVRFESINENEMLLKANTLNIENGKILNAEIKFYDYELNELAIKKDKANVENSFAIYKFNKEKLEKELGIENIGILKMKGFIYE